MMMRFDKDNVVTEKPNYHYSPTVSWVEGFCGDEEFLVFSAAASLRLGKHDSTCLPVTVPLLFEGSSGLEQLLRKMLADLLIFVKTVSTSSSSFSLKFPESKETINKVTFQRV